MVREELRVLLPDGEKGLLLCRNAAASRAENIGFNEDERSKIMTAVFEACVNAATHGQRGSVGLIYLSIITYDDRFEAVVHDSGKGFACPDNSPIPPASAPRGRGIPLMKAFMDKVTFETDRGCKVTLVKYLPKTSHSCH